MISTGEAWQEIKSGRPFSVAVVSYDRRHKSGGKILEYSEARMHRTKPKAAKVSKTETVREAVAADTPGGAVLKNPAHRKNHTINIVLLQAGRATSLIKKIHIPLIIRFNGQTVTP